MAAEAEAAVGVEATTEAPGEVTTEASPTGDDCDVPPDSPLTPFNETAFFTDAALGYMDYAAVREVFELARPEV